MSKKLVDVFISAIKWKFQFQYNIICCLCQYLWSMCFSLHSTAQQVNWWHVLVCLWLCCNKSNRWHISICFVLQASQSAIETQFSIQRGDYIDANNKNGVVSKNDQNYGWQFFSIEKCTSNIERRNVWRCHNKHKNYECHVLIIEADSGENIISDASSKHRGFYM